MASGGLISDYISYGSGAPGAAPDVVGSQYAFYQDITTGAIYVWNLDTAAWVSLGSSLVVTTQDVTPSVAGVTEIRVANGTLTDEGGGVVSIAGGGGAGDLVSNPSTSPDNVVQSQNTTYPAITLKFPTGDLSGGTPFFRIVDTTDADMFTIGFFGTEQYISVGMETRMYGFLEVASENVYAYTGGGWGMWRFNYIAFETLDDTEAEAYSSVQTETNTSMWDISVTGKSADLTKYVMGKATAKTFRPAAGSITFVGTPVISFDTNSVSGAQFDVVVDTGTDDLKINVTGDNETWIWYIQVDRTDI